jgi:hypothetical protein
MSLPPVTLVTGCFYSPKFPKAKTMEETLELLHAVLHLPCYLVLFANPEIMPLLREGRPKELHKITHFVEMAMTDLPAFRFLSTVKKNREAYHPTKDERTTAETHLFTCSKFEMVLRAMNDNPFQTPRFGWIDAFLKDRNASKICNGYYPMMLLNVLNRVDDRFHIQVLNAVDKKYKKPENKREYYSEYRWLVCGCLFTTGIEIGRKILTRLNEVFEETTLAGYGHGEEMLYLEVMDEFYEDIHRSYGNYDQILNNFLEPTTNIPYIAFILRNYLSLNQHREAYDCSSIVRQQIEAYRVDVSWDFYISIMITQYIAAFYYKYDEAILIAESIVRACELNPLVRKGYEANKEYNNDQLKYLIPDISSRIEKIVME